MALIDIFEKPKQRTSALPELTPQEQDSMLRQIAGKSLGLASAIGTVLDTPRAAVWDVLQGKNPLPGIFDPSQRTSGRDVVSGTGKNAPGISDDLMGFATEVLGDPLTYVTLGGSALGKAGKVAKQAGLLGDAAKAATKAAGTTVGKRVARMTLGLDDLLQHGGSDAVARAEATGADLAGLGSEKLGGLVGVGLPFADPIFTLGHGETAQKIAGVMDKAGEALRFSKPGLIANQLFNSDVKGMRTRAGQEAAADLTAQQTRARADALGSGFNAMSDLDSLGIPQDQLTRMLDRAVEEPGGVVAGMGDESRRFWDDFDTLTPDQQQKFTSSVAGMQGDQNDLYKRLQDFGLLAPDLVDSEVEHFARYANAAKGPSRPKSQLFNTEATKARKDLLRDIPEGRSAIEAMAIDPLLTGEGKLPLDDAVAHLMTNYGIGEPEQAQKLAGYFGNREAGRFYGNPVHDHTQYMLRGREVEAAAKGLLDYVSDPRYAKAIGSEPDLVPLSQVLGKTKLAEGGIVNPAAVQHLASRGIDINSVGLPADIAEDATRFLKGTEAAPEALKPIVDAYDSFMNMFKAGVTTPFPGFHARNRITGLWQSFVMGALHLPTEHDVGLFLSGKSPVLRGAENYPAIKRALVERGMPNTPENATRMFQELAFSHEVTGRYHGQGAAAGEDTITDLMGSVPGREKQSYLQGLKEALPRSREEWNPFNIRGVKDYKTGQFRKESKFAPVKGGEIIGKQVEEMNRLAPFAELLRQGYDPATAAAKVKAANVDYSSRAFTDFEKTYLTRLVPFYKFSSRMVPQVLKELVEKPGGKVAQAIRFGNSQRDEQGFTPDYIGSGLSIPLGESAPGTQRYLTGMGLPHEVLNQFGTVGPGGLQKTGMGLLGQLNPAIKTPLELATGKQFFSGRDLKDLDARSGRIMQQAGVLESPKSVPYWLDELLMNSPAARAVSTVGQLADSRKSKAVRAINTLSGARITDVDMAKQREISARNILEDLLRGAPGVGRHESLYVSPENAATMDEETLRLMSLLHSIQRQGAQRRKERAAP